MKLAGLILVFLALIVGVWLLSSLYLMVGVGIAHADWWHAVPTMGYHTALLLDIFLGGWIALSLAFSGPRSRGK